MRAEPCEGKVGRLDVRRAARRGWQHQNLGEGDHVLFFVKDVRSYNSAGMKCALLHAGARHACGDVSTL